MELGKQAVYLTRATRSLQLHRNTKNATGPKRRLCIANRGGVGGNNVSYL